MRYGLTEPPPAGRRAEAWLPATAALERLGGAVAAYAAQLRYGGRTNEPAEVARVLAALDRLAAAARAHRPRTAAPSGRPARTTPSAAHSPKQPGSWSSYSAEADRTEADRASAPALSTSPPEAFS